MTPLKEKLINDIKSIQKFDITRIQRNKLPAEY